MPVRVVRRGVDQGDARRRARRARAARWTSHAVVHAVARRSRARETRAWTRPRAAVRGRPGRRRRAIGAMLGFVRCPRRRSPPARRLPLRGRPRGCSPRSPSRGPGSGLRTWTRRAPLRRRRTISSSRRRLYVPTDVRTLCRVTCSRPQYFTMHTPLFRSWSEACSFGTAAKRARVATGLLALASAAMFAAWAREAAPEVPFRDRDPRVPLPAGADVPVPLARRERGPHVASASSRPRGRGAAAAWTGRSSRRRSRR